MKIRGLAAAHKKFSKVKYDRENPDVYADEAFQTWNAPLDVLLTLNESSPEARFVATELFRLARWWQRSFGDGLVTATGLRVIHDFAITESIRIATVMQRKDQDLFVYVDYTFS